ncbi:predicted protein [Streptomyces viridosporus ATCC 14672]|uniref:Predicted protein n=1 Tax=Streptomyces viridosporus (strain ATCC 14672 / DSM 40746 / JCM 4963 / KCTC 9882 / NRRL B-12104 / FH 1290) TaxID=566461 RepID=D6A5M3_STRV1|nr:predicted protein [Streptomyces viridosporus ATCC 14672]
MCPPRRRRCGKGRSRTSRVRALRVVRAVLNVRELLSSTREAGLGAHRRRMPAPVREAIGAQASKNPRTWASACRRSREDRSDGGKCCGMCDTRPRCGSIRGAGASPHSMEAQQTPNRLIL